MIDGTVLIVVFSHPLVHDAVLVEPGHSLIVALSVPFPFAVRAIVVVPVKTSPLLVASVSGCVLETLWGSGMFSAPATVGGSHPGRSRSDSSS